MWFVVKIIPLKLNLYQKLMILWQTLYSLMSLLSYPGGYFDSKTLFPYRRMCILSLLKIGVECLVKQWRYTKITTSVAERGVVPLNTSEFMEAFNHYLQDFPCCHSWRQLKAFQSTEEAHAHRPITSSPRTLATGNILLKNSKFTFCMRKDGLGTTGYSTWKGYNWKENAWIGIWLRRQESAMLSIGSET